MQGVDEPYIDKVKGAVRKKVLVIVVDLLDSILIRKLNGCVIVKTVFIC